MIVYYIVRDVKPGTPCSYKPGRTLLNAGPIFTNEDAAIREAEAYNRYCPTAGIVYAAVAWEENKPFPADHYEQP